MSLGKTVPHGKTRLVWNDFLTCKKKTKIIPMKCQNERNVQFIKPLNTSDQQNFKTLKLVAFKLKCNIF